MFGKEIGFYHPLHKAKTGINTYRIRALDASDEELIHAEHLKLYVGATPSDDERGEEPQPPRECAAILATSDSPVPNDGENDSLVERGNDSVAIDTDRAALTDPANVAQDLRTPSPPPVRRPGRPRKAVRLVIRPAAVRVRTASSPKSLTMKSRGRPKGSRNTANQVDPTVILPSRTRAQSRVT